MRWTIVLILLVAACGQSGPSGSSSAARSTPPASEAAPAPDPNCGMSISDWCPAPPGDPCGAHKDRASCMGDARCAGVRYRGESLVACNFDERGFADNCPTVGCVSLEHAR